VKARLRQGGRIPRRKEDTVDTVFDNLRNAARAAGDDWDSEGKSFQESHGQPFVIGAEYEEIESSHHVVHVLALA
jgi:hypothetical protein